MRTYDLMSGVFWLVTGILVLVGAQWYPFGTFTEPGGGLYPSLLGAVLIVLSCFLLAGTRERSSEEAPAWGHGEGGVYRPLLTVFALLLIPFIFDYVGFFPTIFIFMLFMTRVVLPLRWITALATSLFSSVGGYFLFVSWLKIQFPHGFLGL